MTNKNDSHISETIIEEVILFTDIIKWSFYSTLVGIIVGISVSIFLKLLNLSINYTNQFKYYFLAIPFAFILNRILISKFTPTASLSEEGTDKVIEAVHKKYGLINPINAPMKILTTIITIASGGSAGKEGPAAQLGGGLISTLANLFHFNEKERKKLVICGISAGFASIFGTPIAGAIFGIEVLFIGELIYDSLLPPFISGMISYLISRQLGIQYLYQNIHISLDKLNLIFLSKIVLSGIFFGIIALIFIELLKLFKRIIANIKLSVFLINIIGGLLLIAIGYFISSKYLGLGTNTIDAMLRGQELLPIYSPFIKMLTTSITLTTGGCGGIITAIYFIGAAAGQTFAQLLHFNIQIFTAIGLAAVVAGATNTPIASSIMALELFGPQLAPYASIAIIISFLMTGHRSIYSNQILEITKSKDIILQKDLELSQIKHLQFKGKVYALIHLIIKRLKEIIKPFTIKKKREE